MSQFSELIGSFIRTGNFPLEADYIFSSELELNDFYSDPLNQAKLHEGLFKIVCSEDQLILYWAVKKDDKYIFEPYSSVKFIEWNESSSMDELKDAGIYEIYGIRTNINDGLPIINAAPGHSISARLTVLASTLLPDNTEKCITQFLDLSNRLGREGNSYVRTYNENNNTENGWSPWRKQLGIIETLINNETFTGYITSNTPILNSILKLGSSGNGINNMIDNGMYSGIYTDGITEVRDHTFYGYGLDLKKITFLETFVLIVINDYAISSKLNVPRRITQLKYSINAITGESTVNKRVGTDSNSTINWGDWESIGSNNLDWYEGD